jgi:hypothetical protein
VYPVIPIDRPLVVRPAAVLVVKVVVEEIISGFPSRTGVKVTRVIAIKTFSSREVNGSSRIRITAKIPLSATN